MRYAPTTIPQPFWISKGHKVSKSVQHEHMFLITMVETNTWFNVHASDESILKRFPPDPKPKLKLHGKTKS